MTELRPDGTEDPKAAVFAGFMHDVYVELTAIADREETAK